VRIILLVITQREITGQSKIRMTIAIEFQSSITTIDIGKKISSSNDGAEEHLF
jgi:hypothetical protein